MVLVPFGCMPLGPLRAQGTSVVEKNTLGEEADASIQDLGADLQTELKSVRSPDRRLTRPLERDRLRADFWPFVTGHAADCCHCMWAAIQCPSNRHSSIPAIKRLVGQSLSHPAPTILIRSNASGLDQPNGLLQPQ